jgi:DNA-binding response OmpR family regulator
MRTAVARFLRDNAYLVHETDSAEAALAQDQLNDCDIAIVDIALPGISGIELTSQMKSQGFTGPIIALTARDTVEDKIEGLTIGMNDYIVKPFDLRELMARINTQLRAAGNQHDMADVQTARFKLQPRRHRFFANGKEQKLTIVEFRIMQKLMQHNHTIVNSQDIIEAAWGDEASLSNPPLRIHISNLRAKISDDSLQIIQTVPGLGYMLDD